HQLVTITTTTAAARLRLGWLQCGNVVRRGRDQRDCLVLLNFLNYSSAEQRNRDDAADHNDVENRRECRALARVVIETPDVANRLRPRSQFQRWKFFGEQKLIDVLKQRLPQRLFKRVLGEKQVKFGLASGAKIETLSCHKVDPRSFSSFADVLTVAVRPKG